MKYILTILVLLVCFSHDALGQAVYSKIFDLYGGSSEYENSSDIIFRLVNSDDGLYAGIGNRCENFTFDCAVISELSLEGDTLWTKVIEWLDPGARGLDKRGDTLIMAGHNTPSLENFYLYYMTLSGDSIKAIEIYPPDGYSEVRIGGVFQYEEYSIVYGTAKEDGQSGFVSLAHWVNSDGMVDTTLILDDGDISDNLYDIDMDPEGNLVFLIDKKDIVPGANPYEIYRRNILKFNNQKEKIFDWETGNENVFTGQTVGRVEVLQNGTMVINAEDNGWVQEEVWGITENGIEWKYIYPSSNSIHTYLVNITEAMNGDILGTGWIRDLSISNGNMAYLFRMSPEGEMLWERAIVDSKNEVPDKVINSFMFDVTELADETILIGGYLDVWYYNEQGEETKGLDAWLIRTDANGCIIEDCEYVQDFATSIPVFSDPIDIDFFPNPASEIINISWPEELEIDELIVYNSIGRVVLKRSDPEAITQLSITAFERGMYFFMIRNERGRVYTEKVMVN